MIDDQVGNKSIFSETMESRKEKRKVLRDSRQHCLSRLNRYKSQSSNGVNKEDAKPEEEDQPST